MLRHQVSRPALRHQVWLTTHARNPEDLIELICPFERSVDLVCPFCLALWKKESFSLLMPDEAYFGPDGVIPDVLHVCPGQPKGLELGKDT